MVLSERSMKEGLPERGKNNISELDNFKENRGLLNVGSGETFAHCSFSL